MKRAARVDKQRGIRRLPDRGNSMPSRQFLKIAEEKLLGIGRYERCEGIVALYTMKIFDKDRRLVGRSEFCAPGDADAAATMHHLYKGRSCELWCGSRKVANWNNSEEGLRFEPRTFSAGASRG